MTALRTQLGFSPYATQVRFIPTGTITATNIQRAIEQILALPSLSGDLGATDNAVLRTDGTDGDALQGSGVIIDDNNYVTGMARLGIGGATPDATNVLSANLPAVLFNRETDDVQIKLNKEASGDTASFLFQTNFSGFAEIGLTGDNDFHFKVSPDNFSTPYEAIIIDNTDGSVDFPIGASINGDAIADFLSLASTANGLGASLIGIEDAGGLITATNVEGALAENRTAIDAAEAAITAIEADYLTSSDIGTSVQAYDTDLDAWAGVNPSSYYTAAQVDAGFQPLDSDLTAIAALTTTSFGRGLLTEADASSAFGTLKQDATEGATGVLDKATDAEIRAATSGAHAICAEDLSSASALVTLTDAATVAIDWTAGINFTLTLTTDRILGNPTNEIPGTWRTVFVISDGGPDTLTFGSEYGGVPPTLDDITTTKGYLLSIYCRAAGQFLVFSADGSPA